MRYGMRCALAVVIAIGCGCSGTGRGGGGGGAPPRTDGSASAASQVVLEGLWADPVVALSFEGGEYQLRERLHCVRLPCASTRRRRGTWSRDGAALHLATVTYELSVEDGGETIVLVPVAIAADGQATLRLRRQHLPELAGTSWASPPHAFAFTSATEFTRDGPCESCEGLIERTRGTWTLENGELSLRYEGAEESFGVLFEGETLVLIGPLETIRLERRASSQ